jgi:hypothetical protein
MTNPLTKRFTPVVAAVQAGIMKVELDEAQRQAALKLPRKQALRELHKVLQAKLDAALLHTITHQLGHEPKEEEVSKGQLEVEPCHEPGFDHGEIYSYMGTAILYAGPIELGGEGEEMRARRDLLILNDAPHIDLTQIGVGTD